MNRYYERAITTCDSIVLHCWEMLKDIQSSAGMKWLRLNGKTGPDGATLVNTRFKWFE